MNNPMDIGYIYGLNKANYNNKTSISPSNEYYREENCNTNDNKSNTKDSHIIANENVSYLLREENSMENHNNNSMSYRSQDLSPQEFIRINMAFPKEDNVNNVNAVPLNINKNRSCSNDYVEDVWKNMTSFLGTQIGRMAEVEFSVNGETVIKNGYIDIVGENYIVMSNPENNSTILCDNGNIKFITFYD